MLGHRGGLTGDRRRDETVVDAALAGDVAVGRVLHEPDVEEPVAEPAEEVVAGQSPCSLAIEHGVRRHVR